MPVHREVVNGLLLDSIAYNFTPLSSVSMRSQVTKLPLVVASLGQHGEHESPWRPRPSYDLAGILRSRVTAVALMSSPNLDDWRIIRMSRGRPRGAARRHLRHACEWSLRSLFLGCEPDRAAPFCCCCFASLFSPKLFPSVC